MARITKGMTGPRTDASPTKTCRGAAAVVTAGIALYIGSVGVAEVMAGDVAVSKERMCGGVGVELGVYGPPTLMVG